MQITTRLPKRRTPARSKRTARPAQRVQRAEPPSVPLSPEAAETRDARRGGGPQDRALYACSCGYAFTATVTTSVHCPHCGTEQAW